MAADLSSEPTAADREHSARLWALALAKAKDMEQDQKRAKQEEERLLKQQPLVVVVELAKALRSVLRSDTLGLSESQLERGDAATVAYSRWWLEQHGLDLHGRPLDTAENRTFSARDEAAS